MKTTIDIPDDVLKEVMAITRADTKREAVVGVLREHLRRRAAEEVIKMFGTFKNFMSQEELRAMREDRNLRHDKQRGSDHRQLKLDRSLPRGGKRKHNPTRPVARTKRSGGLV